MNVETTPPTPEKKTPWYLTRATVIWGLMLIGPLALPILFMSPKFKLWTKIGVAASVVVLTYLSYVYTPILLNMILSRGLDIGPSTV